jgi:hypothetical protein
MTPYLKLVSSAITLISSQEGEVGETALAVNATFIVAVVWVLFAFAAFSFATLLMPELVQFQRENGKWVSLLVPVMIWLIQFPSVRRTAKAILEGKCARVSQSYAVWSMVAALIVSFASLATILAFK